MGICEVIAAQHAEATALFDQLAPLAGDDRRSTAVMSLAARLAIAIKTHALAEERVLYAAIRTAGERCAACALEGPHELHALEMVIDKMLALRPGAEFRAALAVARRLFDHHVHHERVELMPAVIEALPDDECDALGYDLLAEKRRLRPQVARQIEV
jgi:hypothetical protein